MSEVQFIELSRMAGELASRWNLHYPSLLGSYEKLRKLGLTHRIENSVVIVSKIEEENV